MQIHGALLPAHERPVKIVYNREESFVGHPPPSGEDLGRASRDA